MKAIPLTATSVLSIANQGRFVWQQTMSMLAIEGACSLGWMVEPKFAFSSVYSRYQLAKFHAAFAMLCVRLRLSDQAEIVGIAGENAHTGMIH